MDKSSLVFQIKFYFKLLLFDFIRLVYIRIFYRIPKVFSLEKTAEELSLQKVSFARFGDGEFNLILGHSIGFQNFNPNLAIRLKQVLSSNNSDCLILIPGTLNSLKGYRLENKLIWIHLISMSFKKYFSLLDSRYYYNSLVTRPYIDLSDKTRAFCIYDHLKKIWENQDVIVVEGKNSKFGVNNDLLSGAKSIKRIVTVQRNAWDKYADIFSEVQKIDKNVLVLIALGPTATILAYDLSCLGYQACDVGHLDVEYDWYLSQASRKTSNINGKDVNEINSFGDSHEFNDEYINQVLKWVI
jgi:glycosyltransferase family protein